MEEIRQLIFIDPSKGIYLKEVDSTNNYILTQKILGSFVVAETQTSGRGRSQRQWFSSERNNLYFSALVQLDSFISLTLLSLFCGKAVHETCKEIFPNLNLSIKWPNDIYLEDKKIAGILIEMQLVKDKIFLVIGIGVNFYFSSIPESIPNLGMLMNSPPTYEFKQEFINKMISKINQVLFHLYSPELLQEDIDYVYNHSYLRNKKIQFDVQDNILIGEFLGYNESGFLMLSVGEKIYILQDTTPHFGVIKNE